MPSLQFKMTCVFISFLPALWRRILICRLHLIATMKWHRGDTSARCVFREESNLKTTTVNTVRDEHKQYNMSQIEKSNCQKEH